METCRTCRKVLYEHERVWFYTYVYCAEHFRQKIAKDVLSAVHACGGRLYFTDDASGKVKHRDRSSYASYDYDRFSGVVCTKCDFLEKRALPKRQPRVFSPLTRDSSCDEIHKRMTKLEIECQKDKSMFYAKCHKCGFEVGGGK